jgi:23S rRNA pseudouridine2605 synthase
MYDDLVVPVLTRRIGLARALSKLGVCSRSQAAEWIRSGRVRVNGNRCQNPETPVDLERDHFSVDGSQVTRAQFLYFMLNKPRGIVTTASDERVRPTVLDLLPPKSPWLAPVGRLDKASEGLLLLTNDSEWGARILGPASHVDKTYHVQIAGIPDGQLLQTLRTGILCDAKTFLRVKSASVVRVGKSNAWLAIRLDEGKNRQIRRIFEALDIEVLRLIRIAIGPLALGPLPKGSARPLSLREKHALDMAVAAARSKPSIARKRVANR